MGPRGASALGLEVAAVLGLLARSAAAAPHFDCRPGAVAFETAHLGGRDAVLLRRGPGCPTVAPEPCTPTPTSTRTSTWTSTTTSTTTTTTTTPTVGVASQGAAEVVDDAPGGAFLSPSSALHGRSSQGHSAAPARGPAPSAAVWVVGVLAAVGLVIAISLAVRERNARRPGLLAQKAAEEAEAARLDGEEAERRAREELERMARGEAERRAREEAEQRAREEATALARRTLGEFEFRVVLDKTTGREIGARLKVHHDQEDAVEVTEVIGGLMQEWNEEHPELAVKRGDRIVECNGVRHGTAEWTPNRFWWTHKKEILELVITRQIQEQEKAAEAAPASARSGGSRCRYDDNTRAFQLARQKEEEERKKSQQEKDEVHTKDEERPAERPEPEKKGRRGPCGCSSGKGVAEPGRK